MAISLLQRAAAVSEVAARTDGELLTQFVAQRDEAAFAALVRRHGPMVLGVCRRALGNAADAEDAFQAAFLVLVQKATSLVSRPVLGDWLHGVARRVALKARTAAARRRQKEQGAARPVTHDEEGRNDWLPLLDEELGRLPARYRAPIVLCDLEGKTRREAARHLGAPEGTVAGRLARGRALLARRLLRRGQMLAGVAPVALAGSTARAGLPAGLLRTTVAAGLALATGKTAGPILVSATALALAQGALHAMLWHKIKTVALACFLLLVPAGLTYRALAGSEPAAGPVAGNAQDRGSARPADADRRVAKAADNEDDEPPPRPVVRPTPGERFTEQNHTYREGTGKLMERTELPGAVVAMMKAVNHPRLAEEDARQILTEAIYRFLDDFVEGGATIVRSERGRLAEQADRQVERRVKDKDALERFRKWRQSADPRVNPLYAVFTHPDSFPFHLSEELKKAGWTLEVRDTCEKLRRYRSYFGLEPEVVFHLQKAVPAKEGKRPFLSLVIFPTERIRDSLKALETPYVTVRPVASMPPLELFWQTSQFTVLAAQGPVPQEQAVVAAEFRRFFLGPVLLTPAQARQSPRERFLSCNPDYPERTGKFYEASYLPAAARAMKEAVNDPALDDEDAARILKELIHGFLAIQTEGGGAILSRTEIARLVHRADEQVEKRVKSEAALERFRKWRRTTDREVNPLCFLMTANDPFPYKLSEKLKDAGWGLEVRTAARKLEAYKDYFGQAPEMILYLENGKVGAPGRRPSLTLVVFRTEALREPLSRRRPPYVRKDKGDALRPLSLFWQADDHVVMAAEGDFGPEQARVAADFRLYFTGQGRYGGVEVPID